MPSRLVEMILIYDYITLHWQTIEQTDKNETNNDIGCPMSRQAWVWQDEWYGLTMDDIRDIGETIIITIIIITIIIIIIISLKPSLSLKIGKHIFWEVSVQIQPTRNCLMSKN